MSKLLFIDFDGVLFNTVAEAFYICTHTTHFKHKTLPLHAYQLFLKYRPYVGPAWNYYHIMQTIIKHPNTFKKNLNFIQSAESQTFENDFFETRQRIKKENYVEWLKLNKPYPFFGLLNSLLTNNKEISSYIISTKDSETIFDLLQIHLKYPMNFYKQIYGHQTFQKMKTKKAIIQHCISKNSIQNESCIFIDDSAEHLKKCEELHPLHLIQANWGYITDETKTSYLMDTADTINTINNIIHMEELR